ncbi:HEAT repeat domain-containing protein [Nodosilinea sp. LEGE 07088]|uniref:phycobilisome degradation protein NblB n=1 Tax=Nodosilinea sp. LEGE 07088 TaxID=2777968 RepID=UPI0018805269|nr:HEAT repeat domain-containing protein [Nodosilinea sp. LEGE 07088]MBE9139350.1 HEAT repeat domain-containing protein [Nodosilinea sp. LEGE 07088]
MAITPDSVRELLHSDDYGDRLRAVNQLRGLEPADAFDLVQLAANDGNARVRYAAISQIASLGHQDLATVAPLLLRSLTEDPEPDVQAAAADTIGGLKLKSAYPELANLYHSTEEWLVKFSIVAALGELGEPQAFDLLQEALTSDNELIATAAIGALGELGDSRALPLLLNHADHADWQVRHRLVQALAQFSEPEAKAALQKLTADSSEIVAGAARQHLEGQ